MLEGSRNHDSGKGAPSAEFGIAKQDMRPRVQKHLDNLQAQVSSILERYNVSNFEELQALGEENSDNVSKDDIDRLAQLAEAIHTVVETGEAQYEALRETTEAEVSTAGFNMLSVPDCPSGNLAFYAVDHQDKEIIIKEDGSRLLVSEEYGTLGNPAIIDGQIVFNATKNRESVIVKEDGTVIGTGKRFDSVREPIDINGIATFRVTNDGIAYVVTEEGREIGKGNSYNSVGDPQNIAGQIVFTAYRDGKWYLVKEDDSELYVEYTSVGNPQDIGGKIAFTASKHGKNFIVTEDGREIGKNEGYREVGDPQFIGGKIVFRAKETQGWVVASEDGIITDRIYLHMRDPVDVNGMVAFAYKFFESGSWEIKIEGLGEVCRDARYDDIYNFYQVDPTHIMVIAKKGDKFVRHIHVIPAPQKQE
jgi:hypothetical protein